MPWRKTKDPYTIWLSEIILQQTQVVQGTPYFERFISAFPGLKELAESTEDQVLKLWQGLGYYSRGRNLFYTAQHIYYEMNGKFPNTYMELLKLKGVGEYTAAAIASICHGEPVAVVDGNVVRVISRLFKIATPFSDSKGKAEIKSLAAILLDPTAAGIHNQAMMELGALICKPKNPLCNECPIEEHCLARKDNLVEDFPIKTPKLASKIRYFHFIVPLLTDQKTTLIKRTGNDIWKNMFTFPMIETYEETGYDMIITQMKDEFNLEVSELISISKLKHILSHRVIHASFYLIKVKENLLCEKNNTFDVGIKSLKEFYSLPRLITKYLETKEISIHF